MSERRLGIPSEILLRSDVIYRLQNLPTRQSSKFLYLFDQFTPGVNKKWLSTKFVEVIQEAKRSDHWGKDDMVSIGPYDSEASYYTLLGHESCHRLLDLIGGNKRVINRPWEEPFCYRFSESVCRALELPYDANIESAGLGFQETIISRDWEKLQELQLTRQAVLLGFSPQGEKTRPVFYWSKNSVPVMIAPVVIPIEPNS